MTIIFFFNDTATTEIYTLSLHDALPIYAHPPVALERRQAAVLRRAGLRRSLRHRPLVHRRHPEARARDRKSTRLNSSHANISYAVFCLKKKQRKSMSLKHSAALLRSDER